MPRRALRSGGALRLAERGADERRACRGAAKRCDDERRAGIDVAEGSADERRAGIDVAEGGDDERRAGIDVAEGERRRATCGHRRRRGQRRRATCGHRRRGGQRRRATYAPPRSKVWLRQATCSHGAERVMSRKESRPHVRPQALAEAMRRIVYPEHLARQLVEEAPAAYRDVVQVLEDQTDLVRRRIRLEPPCGETCCIADPLCDVYVNEFETHALGSSCRPSQRYRTLVDLRLARLKSIGLIAAVGCATGDRDHAEGVARPLAATPPSAAAQRLTAMIDRAGLTASGHPEITWRENDLLARGATAEVVLPASPDAAFHVKSVRSPARMAVQLLDAQSAAAEVVGGRVVYPGGYARGDVVHQLRDSGTEDFVVVRERGATSLDYDLVLEQGLAGLRLGPNVIELLDARGAPRLRVGTPYVVDDAGSRVGATLSVEGCAYDTSLAAPWGRPVTPPGASSCRVHVAWNDVGLRYPLIVDPAWVSTNNLIQDRDGHAATVLASGLVLLSSGVTWIPTYPYSPTCTSTNLTTSELFDPSTQTFAYTGSTL